MRVTILFFLLSISVIATAQRRGRPRTIPSTTYYVSASGNSSNTGVTPSSPIDKATLLTKIIRPGDQIKLKAGESFEIADWTLSSVDRFKISKWGTGANPKFRGSQSVGSLTWTSEGSGVYSCTPPFVPKWVYINGIAAQWAESAWIDVTAVTNNSASADLDALNPVGATAIFRERAYRFSLTYVIDSYNATTNEATFSGNAIFATTDSYIKLFGKSDYMDVNGEWYYNTGDGKLYVKAASSPAGTDIRIGSSNIGLTLVNSSNVTIDSIDFQEHQLRAVRTISCNNLTVTNSGFSNNRTAGLILDFVSTGNLINNNAFVNTGFNAMVLSITTNSTISNNTFTNVGMDFTVPFAIAGERGVMGNGGAAITSYAHTYTPLSNYHWPVATTIEKNVIDNVCYAGIASGGLDNIVQKNQLSNFMMRLDDGGGIYFFGRRSNYFASRNGTISNNIVWNGIGSVDGWALPISQVVGIYVDNGSDGYQVTNNTVYQVATVGIVNNWNNKSNLFTGNNIMDCLYGFGTRDANTVALSPDYLFNVGNTFSNNVMACRSTTQRCMDLQQWDGLTTWVPFSSGGAADNNIYIQPYTTNINYYRTAVNGTGGALTQYTLAGWKTKLGLDASSTSQTNYITYSNGTNAAQEVKIQVNATNSSAGFTLPAGYKQPDGTVGGSVTIPAWGSFIYLKQTAFP